MIKPNLTLLCLVSTLSCSQVSRKIAGTPAPDTNFADLLKASESVLKVVEDPAFDSQQCKTYLSALEMELDHLDLKKIPRAVLKAQAGQIAETSWQIRTVLHQRLKDFDKDCVYQIQSSFRQFRFIEDYVSEIEHDVKAKSVKDDFQLEQIPLLTVDPKIYLTRTTAAGSRLQFEAGDVFITRGLSFLSSMISRLGSRSTQFSHIVFVYKDEKTNQLQTIESYVGEGVRLHNFEWALKNNNARILWLRSKDAKLAKKASDKIYALVKSREQMNKPIKYDYELNFNDAQTMSCAEVSQVAFEMASGGQFKIPYYPNEISGAKSLITRLKIAPGPTYEPGDMEIDPRFMLLGEFSDLRLTRESRQKDAVMSEVYRWMNQYDYELVDNMKSKMAGGIIYKARKTFIWPLLQKALKIENFSKEVPPNMLSTLTLINQIGEVLLTELQAKEVAHEQQYGVPMNALEMKKTLNDFREADLNLFENPQTRKSARFHQMFRAK